MKRKKMIKNKMCVILYVLCVVLVSCKEANDKNSISYKYQLVEVADKNLSNYSGCNYLIFG